MFTHQSGFKMQTFEVVILCTVLIILSLSSHLSMSSRNWLFMRSNYFLWHGLVVRVLAHDFCSSSCEVWSNRLSLAFEIGNTRGCRVHNTTMPCSWLLIIHHLNTWVQVSRALHYVHFAPIRQGWYQFFLIGFRFSMARLLVSLLVAISYPSDFWA